MNAETPSSSPTSGSGSGGFTRAEAREQFLKRTELVSTTSRNLSYGVLGTSWAVMVLRQGLRIPFGGWIGYLIVSAAALALVTLLLDYLQAWTGYHPWEELLHRLDGTGLTTDSLLEDRFYKISVWCYRIKVWTALSGGLLLVVGIISGLAKRL